MTERKIALITGGSRGMPSYIPACGGISKRNLRTPADNER